MIGEEVIAYYGDAGDGEELFEKSKLVRCKDCKYWRTDEKVRCRLLPYADADDFCSYGERIEE